MSSRGPASRGLFLTFEGPEGAGKTTQAERLRDRLRDRGLPVVLLREPGGTSLGEAIRELLLTSRGAEAAIAPRADAFLFNAARAQLMDECLEPALAAGTTVICTRFTDSTLAYQGYGMGLPLDELRTMADIATGGVGPDLTLLLDLPAEVGLARKRGEETRFEADFDLAFHRRVRDGFLALAAQEPARWAVIDATRPPDEVAAWIDGALASRIGPAFADVSTAGHPSRNGTARSTEPNAAPVRIHR